MKVSRQFTVLCLFLLVPALITRAQKVSVSGTVYENGRVKKKFLTPEGSISIILPDDMRSGDQITGTVIYEPAGRNEKEKNKNRDVLISNTLSAEALKDVFVLQNNPQATIHGGAEHSKDIFVTEFIVPATYTGNSLRLIVRDASNNILTESSLTLTNPPSQTSPPQNKQFVSDKSIYLAGEQALIYTAPTASKHKGGSLVYLNRTRQKELKSEETMLTVLASSPRMTIVTIPENISGSAEFVFKDGDGKILSREKIHVLDLTASCAKTNLRKGESTVLNVKVNGLEGCSAGFVRLSLDNSTSNSVKMGTTDHEELMIKPEMYSNGVYMVDRSITALRTGGFNIDIAVSFPSSVYMDPEREQVNFINEQTQDILFPGIDRGSKLKVYVGGLYLPKKSSSAQPQQKNWPVNNFQLELDGLPCNQITKVEGLKLVMKNAEQPLLTFHVPANDVQSWQEWLENKTPRNGTIKYFDESTGSYLTIAFRDAKPVSVLTAADGSLKYSIMPLMTSVNYSQEIISKIIADIDPGREW